MKQATRVHRFLQTISDLTPGDHLCCLYQTEAEHRAAVVPFLRQGLERREKVIYIAEAHTAEAILGYLRDSGLGVEPHLACGQLRLLAADEAHLGEGAFDPDRVIALLQAETTQALAEGYSALRVANESEGARPCGNEIPSASLRAGLHLVQHDQCRQFLLSRIRPAVWPFSA